MNNSIYKEITARLPLKRRSQQEVVDTIYSFPASTSRDDIINWLIESQFVERFVIKLVADDDTSVDDVIQDIYLTLLELTQEDWDRLSSQGYSVIKAYVSGMIVRQIKSSSSPTYYKYRRYNQNKVPLDETIDNEYSQEERQL